MHYEKGKPTQHTTQEFNQNASPKFQTIFYIHKKLPGSELDFVAYRLQDLLESTFYTTNSNELIEVLG